MIAAFVFKQYYMWGVKDNFRGIYDDEEQLLIMLRGSREYCFLETMDLETLEFHRYEWQPTYELKDNRDPEVFLEKGTRAGDLTKEVSHKLVQRWPPDKKPPEVIPFSYEWLENTVNTVAKMKYYEGEWEKAE